MTHPASSEPNQQPASDAAQYSLLSYLAYWPAIVIGLLVATGILSVGTSEQTRFLAWVPAFLLLGLILLAIIIQPRPKKHKETPWERREREEAEAALAAEEAKKATAGASVADAAPSEAAAQVAAPAAAEAPKAAAAPVVAGDVDVLIMWGSETGTAQGLAEMTETKLKDGGVSARAVSIGNVKVNQLPGFKKLLVITSTWGDGEPPSNAIDMWEALQKEKVDLSGTRFSVLSLGDTAYPLFCKCGKDFDEFLASHGAQRLHPRVDCDLDYEANFEKWLSGVQSAL